ncbi:MAG TPA: hypothetical protein DDZ80_02105, partial [Cyanobacteria bacterium UBA8803]|nr:hypothetical protein [Cyanobacteria bacterium UBA8803]
MGYHKYLSGLGALSFAICVELVTFSLLMPSLRAQSLEVSLTFPSGQDVGAPARTGGGGQRSGPGCLKGKIPLTALTPKNNLVKTVSDKATLFVYVPETQVKSAELVVVDEEGEQYKSPVTLTKTGGIVELSWPATLSLQTGKEYKWQLSILCDSEDRSTEQFVRGLIQRQPMTTPETNPEELNKNLAALATNPQDAKKRLMKQAEEYAQTESWSEVLTILARLQQRLPNDPEIADSWQELLNSQDLAAIATQPLVSCCTANSQASEV